MRIITEELTEIKISDEKKISKKLAVFYNPIMKLNRDVSILLLNTIKNKNMQIALPLAGSGVRGIRFLKELKKEKIKNITFNDYSTLKNIKENLNLNNLDKDKRVFLENKDANLFLLQSKGFDYIDIDPFGTPNPFLESSIVRLARSGILAITATDTSALAGSSSKACLRKYWAKPMRNELMHEIGIRILIRKVQLMGAQNDKALIPIFSYSKDHYYRIFFKCDKGKQKVDLLLKKHNFFLYNPKTYEREVSEYNHKKRYDYAGPLWTGKLWDENVVEEIYKQSSKDNTKLYNLISLIKEESKIDVVGFYDLHKMKKDIPKIESILEKDKVTRTHFLGWGVRAIQSPF